MNKQKGFILLVLGMIITKALAFSQNIALSYYYGTSIISDAFIICLTFPNVIFGSISSALGQCYVPIYNSGKQDKNFSIDSYNTFLILFFFIIGLIISIIVFIFANDFTILLAAGFNDEAKGLVTYLIKIVCWSALFVFFIGILQGYFQSKKHFGILAFINAPLNVGLIIAIIVSQYCAARFLGYGVLSAYLFQVIILLIFASFVGFKINFHHFHRIISYIKKTFHIFLPIFLSMIIIDLNAMIDKSFGTTMGVGVVSGMEYGYKVASVVYSIIANPILMIEFPIMSEIYSSKDLTDGNNYTKKIIIKMLIIYSFLILCLCVFAKEIISVLFLRGSFDQNSLKITTVSLIMYSISLLPMVIRNVLDKIFISNLETRIPLINTVLTVLINVVGDIFLSRLWNYQGLILATIFSFSVSCIYLIFDAKKRYNFTFNKKEIEQIGIIILLNLFAFLLLYLFKLMLNYYFANVINKFVFFSLIIFSIFLVGFSYFKILSRFKLINLKEFKIIK